MKLSVGVGAGAGAGAGEERMAGCEGLEKPTLLLGTHVVSVLEIPLKSATGSSALDSSFILQYILAISLLLVYAPYLL